MTPEAADVALVCITHNSSEHLAELISSVPAAVEGLRYRLVMVDSGSTDGTPDRVRKDVPAAEVCEMGANRGFSAGINAGVEHLRRTGPPEAVVVLNPDVRLGAGSVRALLHGLDDPRAGMCVPRLVDEHGDLLPSLRRVPTVATTWCDALLGGPAAARFGLPSEVIRETAFYEQPRVVAWATGGLVALSWRCLDVVGPWNESFFMYEEEVEYCLRIADAGLQVRYVPDARATRIIGPGPVAEWANALMKANRVAHLRERRGRVAGEAVRAGLLLGELLRTLMGRRESRAAVWGLLSRSDPEAIMRRWAPQANAVVGWDRNGMSRRLT